MFCQVLWCDLPVCPHGVCILNRYDYTCKCDRDFWGRNCNMTSEDCATTVCSGNGLCITDIISNKTCSCNTEWTGMLYVAVISFIIFDIIMLFIDYRFS